MLTAFLLVLVASAVVTLYRAYRAISTSPTAVAPQEFMRFLTFGAVRDRKFRTTSLAFHIAIITSLMGHLFIFVKDVPTTLSKAGMAIGLVALASLIALIVRRIFTGDVLAVSLLALATVLTGTMLGFVAPRDYLVEKALSMPTSFDLATALLLIHVACASALAAALPITSMCHITAVITYFVYKLRGRQHF